MGVGVMTERCSALPARHGNTTSPLVRTRQPWGIAQPRLLRPAVTQHAAAQKIEADFWEMALEKSKRRDTCGPTVDVTPVPIGAGPCLDQHPMPSPAGSPRQGCTAAQGGQNADRVPSASPALRGRTWLAGWRGCTSASPHRFPPSASCRQLG